MLPRQIILLFLLRFVPLLEAVPARTCIQYETYQAVSYGMEFSHDVFSHWLSNRKHRVPRKYTRTGIRSKLAYCCDRGYKFSELTSSCEPVCYVTCRLNEHCVAPNYCGCDEGFRRLSFGKYRAPQCVRIEVVTSAPETTEATTTPASTTTASWTTTTTTTPTTATSTTTTTTTPKPATTTTMPASPAPTSIEPESAACSCAANEQCSGDTCVCQEGYQIAVRDGTSKCEPKCEPACHHADCVAPERCACWPGYLRINDTACHQRCTKQTCVFGECSASGTCVCLAGFRSSGDKCIWAGDAILSEPQSCDCWLRLNSTTDQCLVTCDSTTERAPTNCINATLCEYSGEMLACQNELYTCSAIRNSVPTETAEQSTSPNPPEQEITEKLAKDPNESSGKMTLIIVGCTAFILAVALCTYIWLKYGSRFASPGPYAHMREAGESEAL